MGASVRASESISRAYAPSVCCEYPTCPPRPGLAAEVMEAKRFVHRAKLARARWGPCPGLGLFLCPVTLRFPSLLVGPAEGTKPGDLLGPGVGVLRAGALQG